MAQGYQPMIAYIANPGTGQAIPVYIEGRSGNSQTKYPQADTLSRVFPNLGNNGIGIGRFSFLPERRG